MLKDPHHFVRMFQGADGELRLKTREGKVFKLELSLHSLPGLELRLVRDAESELVEAREGMG